MVRRLDASAPTFAADYATLIRARGERLDAAEAAVRPILADVRARGVVAVLEYAARFDAVMFKAEESDAHSSKISRFRSNSAAV